MTVPVMRELLECSQPVMRQEQKRSKDGKVNGEKTPQMSWHKGSRASRHDAGVDLVTRSDSRS